MNNKKIKIKSIGWSLEHCTGGYSHMMRDIVRTSQPHKDKIFEKTFKNFGRLDSTSKAVCSAISFTLKTVKLYPLEDKQRISLFYSDDLGSLEADKKYFNDFLSYGEIAGRANLFLYTLPSSPLGEASVHFGLTGSISYITNINNNIQYLYHSIEDHFALQDQEIEQNYLIGIGNGSSTISEAIFLLLSNSNVPPILESESILNSKTILNFEDLKALVEGGFSE